MDKKTRKNVADSIRHIRSVLDDLETDLERHRNAGHGDGQHLSDAIANADTVADEAGNLGNMLVKVEAAELRADHSIDVTCPTCGNPHTVYPIAGAETIRESCDRCAAEFRVDVVTETTESCDD